MATENLLLTTTLTVSGNNLSAATDDFLFVKHGATDGDVVQATSGDRTIGINQHTGKNNEGMGVAVSGISKLRLGGTVSFGDLLKSNATGNGVADVGDLNWKGAIALADGSSSELIPVLIIHSGGSSTN